MDCCQPKTGLWQRLRSHRAEHQADCRENKKLVLVGTPNVGKSVIFNALTGAYVTVSNYPGTTVDVSRGQARLGSVNWEVVDTPGMYSLLPITEEERVTRTLLLAKKPSVVLHVIDAKNLERMLNMTLQLIEAELPLILVINMMDEADRLGLSLDGRRLHCLLGVPVVTTAAALGHGLNTLKKTIINFDQQKDKGQVIQDVCTA